VTLAAEKAGAFDGVAIVLQPRGGAGTATEATMAARPRRAAEETVRIAIAELVFRADRPRAIDRVIDYFGERDPVVWPRSGGDIGSTAASQTTPSR
jgi:hypothetical protein